MLVYRVSISAKLVSSLRSRSHLALTIQLIISNGGSTSALIALARAFSVARLSIAMIVIMQPVPSSNHASRVLGSFCHDRCRCGLDLHSRIQPLRLFGFHLRGKQFQLNLCNVLARDNDKS